MLDKALLIGCAIMLIAIVASYFWSREKPEEYLPANPHDFSMVPARNFSWE